MIRFRKQLSKLRPSRRGKTKVRKTKTSVQGMIDIEVKSSVEITEEEAPVAVLQAVVDVRTTEGNLGTRDIGLTRHHLLTSREGKADRPEKGMDTETRTTKVVVDIAEEGTLDD